MGYYRKFDTIGLILLNDWYVGCSIRDYWADMEYDGVIYYISSYARQENLYAVY